MYTIITSRKQLTDVGLSKTLWALVAMPDDIVPMPIGRTTAQAMYSYVLDNRDYVMAASASGQGVQLDVLLRDDPVLEAK